MVQRLIAEDRAGGHASGVPWSRISTWSRHLARVTAGAPPARAGNPQSPAQQQRSPAWPPLRPAGASAGDAVSFRGPVVRPGPGLQHRRAMMVAARPWATSTLV